MLNDLRRIAQLTATKAWSGPLDGRATHARNETCAGLHATIVDHARK